MSLKAGDIVRHVYATYLVSGNPLVGIVSPRGFSVRTHNGASFGGEFIESLEHVIFSYYSQSDMENHWVILC